MSQEPVQPVPFNLTPELTALLESSDIAYELISESFGISLEGIERSVEQLHYVMPSLTLSNSHIIAFLLSEIVNAAFLDTPSDEILEQQDKQSIEQKIEQIAQTYYTGSLWDIFESLAFCLRMVEIGHMNYLKKETRASRKEFLQQIVNATRPACKLASMGYPEAMQIIFRRFTELGVAAEQAVELTLQEDRRSYNSVTSNRGTHMRE